jgi:hypothetical protein
MPNWCNNGITLTHEDPEMIQRAAKALQEGTFLDEFVPVPKELHIVAGRVGDDNDPKQIELEAQEKSNLEKYGYKTWYDFCVNEWGTKWDVQSDNIQITTPNSLTAGFDSAWAPPCAAYEKLMDLGFEVEAFYYEPGMGYVGKWDNGCDDCYDYSGHDSSTVRDAIGDELDDYFGISESMREYEDENRDELTEWYEDGVEAKGLEPHK